MNPDNSQLLDQLKDIHGAASPGWWPPAPGWWLLALLLALALFYASRVLGRKLAARRRKRELLAALDTLNREIDPQQQAQEYLSGLNRLFRVVALKAFPEAACASLQGEEWVNFLISLLPEKTDTTSLAALEHGPYEQAPEFDANSLDQQVRAWVRLYG